MSEQYIIPIFVPHLGCPNDCTFCNQKSISGQTKQVTAEDVKQTIEEYLKSFKDESLHKEVAFFGGSFTGIDEAKQEELLEAAYEFVKNKQIQSIRISTRPDYIDKEKHNKTQEELNNLSKLYDLYVNRTNKIKQETKIESESKNNYQDNDKIDNIYYLTDDKGIKYTDYARDKHNNDKAFLKDLEIILSNFEKGGYRTSLKQIMGLDNFYYILKNKTCVSIKMLDKNNYIVITSDKPKDFFSTTIKLHNKELDKINEIKKGIVGDSK